ncbi:MAG: hypothetical protein R3E31_04480 [Chloroflexota bacterium]
MSRVGQRASVGNRLATYATRRRSHYAGRETAVASDKCQVKQNR